MNKEYTSIQNLSDEELQSLTRDPDSGAEEFLVRRYVRTVRVCVRPYFLAGGDSEDLFQEGMLGLLSAIRSYNCEKNVPFRAYAEFCIRNRIISAVRSSVRKKHSPLNDGVPLDSVLSDESQSLGFLNYQQNPEEQVLARESEQDLISVYSRCLSKFELKVLLLFLYGLSRGEISARVDKPVKSVDNAISRIRRKLAHLPRGDNSSGCSQ